MKPAICQFFESFWVADEKSLVSVHQAILKFDEALFFLRDSTTDGRGLGQEQVKTLVQKLEDFYELNGKASEDEERKNHLVFRLAATLGVHVGVPKKVNENINAIVNPIGAIN